MGQAMSQVELVQKFPAEHQAALANALDAVPAGDRGAVVTWIAAIIAKLEAMNIAVNWPQILALIPLVIAAIASPATGIGPLIEAILALFIPTPVPVP